MRQQFEDAIEWAVAKWADERGLDIQEMKLVDPRFGQEWEVVGLAIEAGSETEFSVYGQFQTRLLTDGMVVKAFPQAGL